MNGYRLAGDLSHLLAILILLFKIWKTRSVAGISGRCQVLYALVYITRYSDLFTNFISTYNSVFKTVFIGTSLITLCLVYFKFKATYDRSFDTFRIEFLIIPAAILAYVFNHEFTRLEVLWTFSIYLESVAILPQFLLIQKKREAENLIFLYLFCLGSYRFLYILNWIYRYNYEGFYDIISFLGGIVQTIIYCNFFFLYFTGEIRRISVTSLVQYDGSQNLVIRKCVYASNENDLRLVLKKVFEDNLTSIYHGIPESNKQNSLEVTKNKLDLNFPLNSMYLYPRNIVLTIQKPSTNLSSKYTCLLTFPSGPGTKVQAMTVNVPESELKLDDSSLNVMCQGKGIFPPPLKKLNVDSPSDEFSTLLTEKMPVDAFLCKALSATEQNTNGNVVFECVLDPGTQYMQAKRIICYSGADHSVSSTCIQVD